MRPWTHRTSEKLALGTSKEGEEYVDSMGGKKVGENDSSDVKFVKSSKTDF